MHPDAVDLRQTDRVGAARIRILEIEREAGSSLVAEVNRVQSNPVGVDGVHVSAYALFANALGHVALMLQVEKAVLPVVQIPELITSA